DHPYAQFLIHRIDTPPGPAARWLADRLAGVKASPAPAGGNLWPRDFPSSHTEDDAEKPDQTRSSTTSVWTSKSGSYTQRVNRPAITAPAIGASQKSQSWPIYSPPANNAGPVLRAGLTEVFVTGIDTRWIRVRARPIGIPAKPAAAPFDVVPTMMKRKKK